jgi:hypothetical protein
VEWKLEYPTGDMQIVLAGRKIEAQHVEMKVPLYSYGCEKKIKKALSNLKGTSLPSVCALKSERAVYQFKRNAQLLTVRLVGGHVCVLQGYIRFRWTTSNRRWPCGGYATAATCSRPCGRSAGRRGSGARTSRRRVQAGTRRRWETLPSSTWQRSPRTAVRRRGRNCSL